jgi:type I restriction enzyme S subunit
MEKQLPKKWVECNLSDVFEIVTGNTPSKSFPEYYGGNIPWVKPGDINKSVEIFQTEEFLSDKGFEKSRKIPKDSVMVTCIGNLGNVAIAGIELATNQQINTIVITHDLINKKYVYYRSLTFKKWLVENSTSTTISMVNKSNFEKLIFLLPPLAEQNRIVTKLDTLFAQLEAIKASMTTIPLLLKDFRQQVLTQAVTGKLTEEWRKGKKIDLIDVKTELNSNYFLHPIPEKWKHTIVGNIGKVKGGKRLPKGDELVNKNTGLPYIRARDLKRGTVLTDKLMFLKPETQIQIKNYIVSKGDLYITIVGAKIGDAGIIPLEMHGANLTENAAKITELRDFVFNEYISIWLRGTICQSNIQETIMSAAQGKLALTRINHLPVYLPPLQEQQEIVSRVESLFSKADAIEQQYKSLKEKIDTLPQALLYKAFKGELTEQLDSDGDARDLLKKIQELKEGTTKVRKKKLAQQAI